MMKDKITYIQVGLVILLFLCLLPMPYGFYELVRFVSTFGFAYLAYDSFKKDEFQWAFVFVALVLLFQPFAKIALGREMWNVVDVIVAAILGFSVYKNIKIK